MCRKWKPLRDEEQKYPHKPVAEHRNIFINADKFLLKLSLGIWAVNINRVTESNATKTEVRMYTDE